MKKQYINPELQVVIMNTFGVLMASKNAKLLNSEQDNGDALGHGFDFDEDEDEDW